MWALLIPLLGYGGTAEAPVRATTASSMQKHGDDGGGLVDATVPDCAVLEKCTLEELKMTLRSSCVDDPEMLEIELYEGTVVDVHLLPDVASEKADLPTGSFFTVFPDPTGGCAATIVSFEQEDAVPVEKLEVAIDAAEGAP